MNYFNQIRAIIIKNIEGLKADINTEKVSVESPKESSYGDVATNAAMVLAPQFGKNPKDLAEEIKSKLEKEEIFKSVEIAGPGFINIRFSNNFWHQRLKEILEQGEKYGDSTLGNNEKINVEYISANPTGPMHVGHSRGAVFGDALANLLKKAGFAVTKEFYINDAGGQIKKLSRSAYLRYKEALGEEIGQIPEGLYPGEYLIPVGQKAVKEFGAKYLNKPEEEWLEIFRAFVVEEMMKGIKEDLKMLGINFDVFTSEKELIDSGITEEMISKMQKEGLLYTGILEPPKGTKAEDWEEREQLLFKATDFGDDIDRALKKADGSNTYFCSDIAYHYNKFNRGFKKMINVWGADHGGYVKRIVAAVSAVTGGEGKVNVKICQIVNFLDNGEPFKMSKRAGTFVTVRDVIEKAGADVMRFIMLTRKNEAGLDFDFTKVLEQSKDNPVFYVHYANARCCSVLRHAKELFKDDLDLKKANLSLLNDEAELALIKFMAEYPRTIETAALMEEPHRLAYFLQELASLFHTLWNKGKEDNAMRFLDENNIEISYARIALINAVSLIIRNALNVFGIKALEEM